MIFDIAIILILLRYVLWSNIWSILENFSCALKKSFLVMKSHIHICIHTHIHIHILGHSLPYLPFLFLYPFQLYNLRCCIYQILSLIFPYIVFLYTTDKLIHLVFVFILQFTLLNMVFSSLFQIAAYLMISYMFKAT